MAKRICDPTSGSIGKQTYGLGRNGQFVRARVVPANPNTAQQQLARGNLKLASKAYDALTQEQISAWIAKAATFRSRPRLGMSGVLTGNQLFVQLNAALLECSSPMVTDVPADPTFEALTPAALTAAIDGGDGSLTLEQTWTGALPTGTRFMAAAPQRPGVRRIPQMVDLGAVPALANGKANLSALYTARFGNAATGQAIYVAYRQMTTGYYGPTVQKVAYAAEA